MIIVKRGVVAVFLALSIIISLAKTEVQANNFIDGAQNFIETLESKARETLGKKNLSKIEHRNRFRKLMLDSFDLRGGGKWVVGRYWRRISAQEQTEYLKLFEEFIISTYTKRFKSYIHTKLKINGTTSRRKSAFVNTQIIRDNAKPIRIVWRVKISEGRYKIIDIIIEGVSWIQTQRSEFVSVIRNNGGNFASLIMALEKKIAYLNSSKD